MMTGNPSQIVRRCDALSSRISSGLSSLALITIRSPPKTHAPDVCLPQHTIMSRSILAESRLTETLHAPCAKSGLAVVTLGAALSRLAETLPVSCADSGLAGVTLVSPHVQEQIKSLLTGLMLSTPPLARAQLSEALSVVSSHDFPRKWATLLPELIERLKTGDAGTVHVSPAFPSSSEASSRLLGRAQLWRCGWRPPMTARASELCCCRRLSRT